MTGWTPPPLPAQWSWAAELPPWVGRRREMDTLEHLWESVQHGARQVVLVSGDPGTGKSRFVMESGSGLFRQGVPVLVGQCTSDLGLPFDPLVAPIRGLTTAIDRGELELPETEEADTSRHLLTQLTGGVPLDGTAPSLPAMALAAVVSALQSACVSGPLVMVLEDIHWAGESALRALRHILERTADLPLLVLVTHRDSPSDMSDALSTMAAEVLRLPGAHRMALSGLETSAVATYLTALDAGDPSMIQQTAPILRARTGGNPFLLSEVWREIRDDGGLERLVTGQVTVPETVQALVHSRLGKLPPTHRRVIEVGAAIGESFDLRLVHGAVGVTDSLAETFAAASAAASVGLVRVIPDEVGWYSFPHALARQAVLAEIEPFALASTHAAIAEALETGDTRDPARIRALAHHYTQATGLDLEERAVHYLAAAAEVAAARLAYSDAAVLLERAADLAAEPGDRDRLTLAAAQEYVMAGRFDQARLLSEIVATTGEPATRLQAAVCFEEACRLGVGARRATELLRAALAEAPDSADRVHATASLGRSLIFSGHIEEGQSLVEDALVQARQIGDPHLLLAVLDAATFEMVTMRSRHGIERLRHYRTLSIEAVTLARDLGDLYKLGGAAQAQHYVAYVLGDPHLFRSSIAALNEVARTTHSPFWRFRAAVQMASRHLVAGDLQGAGQGMAEGQRLALSLGYTMEQLEGPQSMQSFPRLRETGSLEFARELLSRVPITGHPWSPGLVAIHRELGMAEPARAGLRRALSEDLNELGSSETWPASLALLGDAAVWLRDRAAAEILLAEAEPFTGLNLASAEMLAPFGSADRLIGGLKSVLGDPTAEEHFAKALEMDLAMDASLHVATTHAEWANHLRRSDGPPHRLEAHERAARELADRHDLVRVLRLLQADSPDVTDGAPDGLTAREVGVLRLVGLGHSNKDIAAELFISEHTAANHVRSILQKTRSTNRTAAAHYARVHGLLGEASEHRLHGST